MPPEPQSMTRRLILGVFIVECLASLLLLIAVTIHERDVQLKAFDANLRGTANLLFGGVVDAEDTDDNIILDLQGLTLPREAIYLVKDEQGRILGSAGTLPSSDVRKDRFTNATVNGTRYRFHRFNGERIVDPGMRGGIRHQVEIIYGLPDHHVWHEVIEAVRFFAIASLALLVLTAIVLVWLIRKLTTPIHQLAEAAEQITADDWTFSPPESAREMVELRPLVSALEKALDRLQKSFQLQRRFTHDAAHELKTDVAIVKSSFQLLTMKQRSVEEYGEGIAVGLSDLARLEDTIQRMLTLARLEQPVLGGENECRFDAALERAIQQTESTARMKNVTIDPRILGPVIVGLDARDAFLLCSNLVMNAVQYTSDRSVVEVQCAVRDGQCVLTVRDAGQGFTESELPFLFEPFYRGDPSRSRISGGTGLGLSICKAICDRVKGDIRLENHPAGGALVTVTLPVLRPLSPIESWSR